MERAAIQLVDQLDWRLRLLNLGLLHLSHCQEGLVDEQQAMSDLGMLTLELLTLVEQGEPASEEPPSRPEEPTATA